MIKTNNKKVLPHSLPLAREPAGTLPKRPLQAAPFVDELPVFLLHLGNLAYAITLTVTFTRCATEILTISPSRRGESSSWSVSTENSCSDASTFPVEDPLASLANFQSAENTNRPPGVEVGLDIGPAERQMQCQLTIGKNV